MCFERFNTELCYFATMEMCRILSGKRGFDKLYEPTDYKIPYDTMRKILEREEELRFSQEVRCSPALPSN